MSSHVPVPADGAVRPEGVVRPGGDAARARPAPEPAATGLAAPVPVAARKDSVPAGDPVASAPARWAAEFAGTALLVFAGLGAGMFATEVVDSALGFGLGLLAAVVAFGHVSGGHFNPAVTLAAVVAGRTPVRSALGYLVAQVLGALAAAGVLWAVLGTLLEPSTTAQVLGAVSNGYGANSTSQAGWTTVLLVEFVATALFALVVLGATAPRANAVLAPVAMAAALVLLLTVTAPFDGGSLNPARSTGAAVVAGVSHLPQLWLFWLAPLLGGLVAGLVHRLADLARTRSATAVEPTAGTAADADAATAAATTAAGATADPAASGTAATAGSTAAGATADSATNGATAPEATAPEAAPGHHRA